MKVWRYRTDYLYHPPINIYLRLRCILQLVVADPQALFHIDAKNVYNYRKTLVLQSLFERTLGRSVVWAEGDEHKRMRSVLNSCFTLVSLLVVQVGCYVTN